MSDITHSPVPRPGSSLSLALMAAGSQQRALRHWLVWWHDISAVPYGVSDPSIAERKLAWWSQAVASGFEQTPQHPLLVPLLGNDQARAQAPPLAMWLKQIEGQLQLTQQTRWLDETTLMRHMGATTGSACEGAAWMCGARDQAVLRIAHDLGIALRRSHILFRLGQDARQGWLHIPIDVLQAHEVRAHELLKHPAGPTSEAATRLLAAWQAQSTQALNEALSRAAQQTKVARRTLTPLTVLAKLHLALLDDLRAAHYPVFEHRLTLGPWRKIWIAHKARWAR